MNIPYQIEVHDNLLSAKTHNKIWDYVKTLKFYGMWEKEEQVNFSFTLDSPQSPADWMLHQNFRMRSRLARVPLASDEASLKVSHLPIYLLWKELNNKLNNRYELTGNSEGMRSEIPVPETANSNLKLGWRSYINANYNSHVARGNQGFIHRDTPLEFNDEKTVTMVYVANTEWYPSWAGEIKFYPEDSDGLTGEHQQFNFGVAQQRGYNIGWLDCGRLVSPVPGRLIIYDGRCLHSTVPASGALENPSIKIIFRARFKD